ncbi:tetratricopeptide repeat protein [Nonomuraea sp. N2-4H]|jgi:hypothetical protein|uniref:tetratricopeptide repeat protein n=1 Tax=Nonomuraea sp. N2-4H TaxID=3128898 RepID=UPI00324E308F
MYAASPEAEDAERTIARLWHVHLETIGERNPYAVRLLRILACYAPDDIPRDILGADGARLQVLDALRLLNSYSLVTLTEDTVSVHRLIQDVVAAKDETRTDEGDSAPELALTWLADAWAASADLPVAERRMRRRMLSPHVETLAFLLFGLGRLDEAETELRAVLEVRRRVFGEEHPDTLTSRGNLASVLGNLGRLEEAEAGHRAVLEARRRVLG